MNQDQKLPLAPAEPTACTCSTPCGKRNAAVPDIRSTELTDVVVVGGGIAGACAAYHLARTGLEVTVADRHRGGGESTSRGVGVFSPPIRQPYHQIVYDLGEDAAQALWQFSLRSVEGLCDLLAARGESEIVELDRSGGYVLAERHTEDLVRGAFEAMTKAKLPVSWLSSADIRENTGGRGFRGAYRIEGGGALDPTLATQGVLRAAAAAGARVVEEACVQEVTSCSDGFRSVMGTSEVLSTAVVYAADLGGAGFLGELTRDLVSMRAQALLTAPLPRRFMGAFTTDWKTNVWRQRRDGRIVLSGWRHHAQERSYDQGPAIDPAVQLELRSWFEASFPALSPLPVEQEWSGVLGWTPDLLPLVGPLPGRGGEWAITGFGGNALPFAFEAGRAVAHAIAGDVAVSGVELMDPARLVRAQSAG